MILILKMTFIIPCIEHNCSLLYSEYHADIYVVLLWHLNSFVFTLVCCQTLLYLNVSYLIIIILACLLCLCGFSLTFLILVSWPIRWRFCLCEEQKHSAILCKFFQQYGCHVSAGPVNQLKDGARKLQVTTSMRSWLCIDLVHPINP